MRRRAGIWVAVGIVVASADLAGAGEGDPPRVNVSQSEGFSQTPRLAPLPGGGVAAVWREGDFGGAQVQLSLSRDGGETFTPARDISDTPGPCYLPALAVDAVERCFVLWREPLTPAGRIHFSRADAADSPFSPATPISETPPVFSSDLADGAPGVLLAAWDQEMQIRLSRSTDGGDTWSAPALMSSRRRRGAEARLAADSSGRVALLYQEVVTRGQVMLRRSRDGGRRFDRAKLLSQGYPDAAELAVALGPGTQVYAAWVHLVGDFPDPDRVIFWRGRGRGRPVAPGHEPDIAVGPDGAVHLAWRTREGEIVYARSTDAGRTFSTPLAVSQTPGGGGPHVPGHSAHPALAVDPTGQVYRGSQQAIPPENDEVLVAALSPVG